MGNLIIINLLSIVMFIVSVVIMLLAKSTTITVLGGVFALVWMINLVVTNYKALGKSETTKDQLKHVSERLRDSDKKGIFGAQIRVLNAQFDSIVSRKEYFMDKQDGMRELYEKIEEQMKSNIDSAEGFMKTYDYVTCPKPEYLNRLCASGDELVAKYNKLVEKLVDVDTNLTSFDSAYVDDVIDCLEKVKGI